MRTSNVGRFLSAFFRQYLSIVGGFTPLTLGGIVSFFWPQSAPSLDGPLWWALLAFLQLALLRAAYLAGREVEGGTLRLEPRRLTVEAKAALMRDRRTPLFVDLDLRQDIAIVIAENDAESASFARELRDALRTGGWDATITSVNPPPSVATIEVLSLGDERLVDVSTVIDALCASGHPHCKRHIDGETGALPGGGFINIVIPPLHA